jgi:GSH-dependent disulfide-bond oxidoreductase
VALLLEETGLLYEVVPVDTRKGEQHSAAFKAINPNAKTLALVDGEATVFDSNATVLYLAEKMEQFLPSNTLAEWAQMYLWLMFVATGIGPHCGQAVHFKHFAPEPKEYAVNRYDFEVQHHWGIVNEQLARHSYMLGATYTIVDMVVCGRARAVPSILGVGAWASLPHVRRWRLA